MRLSPALSSLLLAGALLAGCNQALITESDPPVVTPGEGEVVVCHASDEGTFTPVAAPADRFTHHLRHGDGVPEGPVPGRAGFVFSASCAARADTDDGPCPAGMAHIAPFCIDRWEAHLAEHSPYAVPEIGRARTAPGVVPQGYASADVAEQACRAVGKRLCTSPEWLRACRGPAETAFPYGPAYEPGACNEGRARHPVVELFGDAADWSARQMNDPRLNQLADGLDVTGGHAACMTPEGLFDLHGNLHEWVADADGTFRGGFYVDAKINGQGCAYRTTAHGRAYHDYSTGFRCCADAR